MIVGSKSNCQPCSLRLRDAALEFVEEYRYLGVHLRAQNGLSFSSTSTIRSFYRAANSILNGRVKPNTTVLMKLLYVNCVPILTYACAVKDFSASDMYRCHVAVNNSIRKIYSYAIWQSIRHLRMSLGYDSIYDIFAKSKKKFLMSAKESFNSVVLLLSTL